MKTNYTDILPLALIALVIIYSLKFYVSKLRNDGPDKIHYFTRVIFMSNLRFFLEIYNNTNKRTFATYVNKLKL